MLLYEHPGSPYAQKIKIALREKAVAFTVEVPATLSTGCTDGPFVAANPRAEVPVLVDGDFSVFDSTIILEYIEDRWPEPPLLPCSPQARAAARMIEDVCDTHYEAANWGFCEVRWFGRATGALADTLRQEAGRQSEVIQTWLGAQLGDAPWFGGAAFGWADVAAAPMVNRSVHYGMGPPAGSALANWHQRLRARPSVATTFAEFEASAATMADTVARYASTGRPREYRDHRLEWMIKSGGIEVVLAGLRNGTIRFPWPNPKRSAIL